MYRNIRSKEETFDFESMAINLQSKFPNFKKDIAWRLALYLRHQTTIVSLDNTSYVTW